MHTKAVKGTYLLRCYASIRKRQHQTSPPDNSGKCNVFALSYNPDFCLIELPKNLGVPEFRVNTHTHTQSPRASRYEISFNCQSVNGFFLSESSRFFLRNSSDNKHTSPVTVAATERGLYVFRRYVEHGYTMSVCRRNVFTFSVKAGSKNSPPGFFMLLLTGRLFESFCFYSASFVSHPQSHSSLCSFEWNTKPARLKSRNTSKAIFRTCLKSNYETTI